ncbi:MAG TPA: hypothetical protein VF668_22335 [Pyrinomonadaceae bacterium]|jgi:hypothetical protein
MNAGHRARPFARALAAAAFALTLAAHAALGAAPRQTTQEPPRKPQGPAAGPVIKLPPGAGVVGEPAPGDARDEAARERAEPRRWEYCVISGFTYRQKGLSLSDPARAPAAVVRYLPTGSEEVEGATEEAALGAAFAKLGEEGWELTGLRTDLKLREGDGETSTVYFFKRPKRRD